MLFPKTSVQAILLENGDLTSYRLAMSLKQDEQRKNVAGLYVVMLKARAVNILLIKM